MTADDYSGNFHRLTKKDLQAQIENLQTRLEESEATLRAIRKGEVDAVVVDGPNGKMVYTLQGADYLYRMLVQDMHDAAIIVSEDGTILFCNQYFTEIVRTSQSTVIGSSLFTHVVPEDQEKLKAWIRSLDGAGKKGEIRFRSGRSSSIPTSISLTRTSEAKGICVVATDLSTQKQIEDKLRGEYNAVQEALRNSQKKYQALVETTGDFIWETDAQGRYTYCSPQMKSLWGIPPESMIGKTLFDRMPDGEREQGMTFFMQLVRSPNPFRNLETIEYDEQGHQIFVETSGVPFFDEAGRLLGYRGVTRDVTNRKRAEEALHESEARLKSVLESMSDILVRWNIQTKRYEYISPSVKALVGYSPDEFLGMDEESALAMVHPDDTAVLRAAQARSEKTGQASAEYRQRTMGGDYIWVSNRMTVVKDIDGQPLYRTSSIRDVTWQKKAEESLAADFAALTRMHEISTRLMDNRGLQPILQEIMDAAVSIMGADKGTLQLLEGNTLRIVAAHSHQQPFLDFFASAEQQVSACGMAMKCTSRVVVPDIETSPLFAGTNSLIVLKEAGVRSVQSTPLVSRSGILMGVLTTHWGAPHNPSEHDLWRLDLLARQAADLIEYSQGEAKVRESETILQSYFDASDVMRGIVDLIADDEIRFIKVNKATAAFMGLTPNQVENKTATEIGDIRKLRTQWIPYYLQSKETGKPVTFNFLDNRGEDRWLSITVNYLGIFPEGFPRFTLVIHDITERKNAEEIIRENEARKIASTVVEHERQRLFSVLETMPIMISLLTPDYHVAFANRSFREAFGESKGRHCYEYCFGRTEPCEFCESYKVLESGKPHQWEVVREDGSILEAYDYPFTDVDGSPLILEMDIDITQQRQAKESVERAYRYARSLIEASLDPLVTISAIGKITDVNEATVKATGASREELIGSDFSQYFTEPAKARTGYQQVFREGHVTDYPLTLRRKDGYLTDVLYNATLYRDSRGEVEGIFAAARDVTKRKRAELELKEYQDHLEDLVKERTETLNQYAENLKRSNEDLERFAYIASHDLQEPLRNVVSFSQLLARRYLGQLNSDADEYIGYIVEGGKRMQALVQDLLEYSRVNTRGQAFQKVKSEDIVDRVLQNLTIIIQDSDAVIRTTALPTILADPTQISLVFQNLIGNAIKFRKSDVPPHINISVEQTGEMWKFAVKDNGIGIDPAFFDRIFEIFQRLHTRDKYPGTGVGLAIVKKIIERHGGQIWVESEVDKGSTFYFTLPVIKDSDQ